MHCQTKLYRVSPHYYCYCCRLWWLWWCRSCCLGFCWWRCGSFFLVIVMFLQFFWSFCCSCCCCFYFNCCCPSSSAVIASQQGNPLAEIFPSLQLNYLILVLWDRGGEREGACIHVCLCVYVCLCECFMRLYLTFMSHLCFQARQNEHNALKNSYTFH